MVLAFLFLPSVHAQVKRSLVLDGWSNYIEIGDHDSLDFNKVLSIEAWINPNCMDNAMIVAKQWCQGEYAFYLSVRNGRLIWSYSLSGLCISPNWVQSRDALISKYKFTHIALVHNQTEIKMFINGNEVAVIQGIGKFEAIRNSSEPFRIGAYKGVSGNFANFWSGSLDELRVWNTELTETQIKSRMNLSLSGTQAGLIANYTMQQESIDPSSPLINTSRLGNILNGSVRGANTKTPYLLDSIRSGFGVTKIADTIVHCGDSILQVEVKGYEPRVIWDDGTTGISRDISAPGLYWFLIEKERCYFFKDSFIVNLTSEKRQSYSFVSCEGNPITIRGKTYSISANFIDTIPGNGGSCDTIADYTIVFHSTKSDSILLNFCSNKIPTYNGDTLTFGLRIAYRYSTYQSCDSTIWVRAQRLDADNSNFLGEDKLVCDSVYKLEGPSDKTVWGLGDTSKSIIVHEPGSFHAHYLNNLGCIQYDSVSIAFIQDQKIFVPNSFSPNGDDMNDCFRPVIDANDKLNDYYFRIFNRWGQKIAEYKQQDFCWDGTFNNRPAPSGIYIWTMQEQSPCSNTRALSGAVHLLR